MSAEQAAVEIGSYVVGGTGLSAMVFMVIRHFILKISRDMTTMQADSTQRDLITGMREEVTRLEALVGRMQTAVDAHTGKIAKLESQLLRNRSSALAALALIEAFDCSCNEPMRGKLVAILHRMAEMEEVI